jgi:hypothetical protein
LPPGPKEHGGIEVRQQPHWALALLAEQFGVRPTASRRYAPVDGARVVAAYVRPDLLEFEPSTAVSASMSPNMQRAGGMQRR